MTYYYYFDDHEYDDVAEYVISDTSSLYSPVMFASLDRTLTFPLWEL